MGTDIHTWIEYRKPGTSGWTHLPVAKFDNGKGPHPTNLVGCYNCGFDEPCDEWCGHLQLIPEVPIWTEHRFYGLFNYLSGVRGSEPGIAAPGLPNGTTADMSGLHTVGWVWMSQLVVLPSYLECASCKDLMRMAEAIVKLYPTARMVMGYDS